MAQHKVLVPLLDGFEEIEAVTIIDVLRRAGVDVTIGGEQAGPVKGSHDIVIHADAALADIDPAQVRMIVLPGGMPGAANLAKHPRVQSLLTTIAEQGGYTAAMCAAPMALAAAGLHKGKKVTSYPGFEKHLDGATYVQDRVVVDGKVVTSRGPGTSMEFALALVALLTAPTRAAELQKGMLVAHA